MSDTFSALLSGLLRSDAARPLVTFYDDASGERAELSVATYANWVAKTSSLLVEEFDLEVGDRILVDLPTHWLGPVFLGAAWNAGLVVCFPGVGGEDDVGAVICGPDGLSDYADRAGEVPVIACALLPLGVRFTDPLPPGVHDFGVEVWSQPDSFMPYDPPEPDSEAVCDGGTQQELVTPTADELSQELAGGGRLLTTANPASPTGLASFVTPLVRGGSTVWIRNADPATWERRYADERATAQLDQPARS
ncbi:MAG: TIGR03089 family protein [Nocardioides sp.]|nr:TIGR03089 family protein [Nocardioides sp.]